LFSTRALKDTVQSDAVVAFEALDILQEQRDIFFANLGKCQSRLDPNQVKAVCPFQAEVSLENCR
jgi:hypothetical protein